MPPGDPYFGGVEITRVINNTTIEANVGVTTVPSYYVGGGTIQGAIIAPRFNNNSASGEDYAASGTFVDKVISNREFVANVGIATCQHFYNRIGTAFKGKRLASSIEEGYSGFDVLEAFDGANTAMWTYPSKSKAYTYGFDDGLWFTGDPNTKTTIRTKTTMPQNTMIKATIDKNDACSNHYIAITKQKDLKFFWGTPKNAIYFMWNCNQKYIFRSF